MWKKQAYKITKLLVSPPSTSKQLMDFTFDKKIMLLATIQTSYS
jgi:hypothetical protein